MKVILLSGLMLACGVLHAVPGDTTLPVPYSRFELTEGTTKVDSEFTLTLKVKAFRDVQNAEILIPIPKGIHCFDDSTKYAFAMSAGESIALNVHLKAESIGAYNIQAHTICSTAETIGLFQHIVADYYMICGADTAACGFRGHNI